MKSVQGPFRRFLGRYLPRRRKSPLFRMIDRKITSLHEMFHNLNYDFETNGESWVAKTVAECGLSGIFFDVGANAGDWALCMNALCAPSKMICFEPLPATFAKLSRNTAGAANIIVENAGMSDRSGSLTFAYSRGSDVLSSAVPDVFQDIHKTDFENIVCSVHAGDSYCARHQIDTIDFLKIDTEGHEGSVLAGFRDMIGRSKIRVIQFEYGMANIYSSYLLKDIYRLLNDQYVIGKVYPNFVDFKQYHPKDEDFLGPNYIAVARNCTNVIGKLG